MGMDLTLEFQWTGWTPWWTSYEGTEMVMNTTDIYMNMTNSLGYMKIWKKSKIQTDFSYNIGK